MKKNLIFILIAAIFALTSCSNVSPNAVDLEVDFSWQGMTPCGWGNPEITIGGIPTNTTNLLISMYDHVYLYDHGKATIPNDGSGIIKFGVLEEIQGPCPPDVPGRYKITVKALDGNNVVVGIGSKQRYFPEK